MRTKSLEPATAFLHFLCTVCGNYLARAHQVSFPIFESSRKTARNIDKLTRAENSLIAAPLGKYAPAFSSTAPNIGN
jgi:hypothetical protein